MVRVLHRCRFLCAVFLLFAANRQIALADEREDFRELARALSQDYLLNGGVVEMEPAKPTLERLSKASGQVELSHGAEILLKGMELVEQNRLEAERRLAQNKQDAAATMEAVRRGDFTRKEVYYDYDDRGNLRKHEYEVDESLMPFITSFITLNSNPTRDPRLESLKQRIALDSTRARSWDQLLPKLPEKFAGPPTKQTIVKIDFLKDGPGGRPISSTTIRPEDTLPGRSTFIGRYVARNTAPKDLHNVTLAVEMFHYSTLPEATLRHVYFIPTWPKGETLELSRTFLPDVKLGGKKYYVPGLELNASGQGFALVSEIGQMAGIVRMQTTVWCDEARQPPTKNELPERAKIVAARLVKLSEERVTSIYAVTPEMPVGRGSPAAPKPADAPKPLTSEEQTQLMLERLLRPVLAFMPADSELARRAKRMLEDFKSVRKELLEKREDDILVGCGEGKRYVGQWGGNFASGGAGNGQFGVLFLECDAQGKRIRAEVFNPDKPEERRLVAGFIAKAYSNMGRERGISKLVMLEPLSAGKEAEPNDIQKRTSIVHAGIKSYRFKFEGENLLGEASTADLEKSAGDYYAMRITMAPTPGDAKELADAKKREEAAPQKQPRAPLADVEFRGRGMAATPDASATDRSKPAATPERSNPAATTERSKSSTAKTPTRGGSFPPPPLQFPPPSNTKTNPQKQPRKK